MVSVALNISAEFKSKIDRLNWINWSELAREELLLGEKLAKDFERFKEIVSKSKFTEKDAAEFAEKVSKSMHERLVKEGLI